MPIKVKKLESKLQGKFGFAPAKNRSDDHRWYEINFPGLPTIATKISHSAKELNNSLVGKVAKQLRVKRSFLFDMIGCTKSLEDYQSQVSNDPYPPWNIKF